MPISGVASENVCTCSLFTLEEYFQLVSNSCFVESIFNFICLLYNPLHSAVYCEERTRDRGKRIVKVSMGSRVRQMLMKLAVWK